MTRSIHTTRRFALSAAAVTALAGIGLLARAIFNGITHRI